MPKVSTVVITQNEEENLDRCLSSVAPFSDEIVVVDSGSTDRTCEIARRYTKRVIHQDWLGYGRQKQFALEQAGNEWVFSIDADEEVLPELRAEIEALDFEKPGYFLPRRVWYLNRWILHGGWYPGYVLRLFRKDMAHFSDEILHERVELDGSAGHLRNPLAHYSYRDIGDHVAKINQFTSLAARQMQDRGRRAGATQLVLSPLFEFFRMYVLKRGFLDGSPGLVIAALHAHYVFLKYAKLWEMQRVRPSGGAS
jgi:glycosyltransferase involved in cell wall biosynthesis